MDNPITSKLDIETINRNIRDVATEMSKVIKLSNVSIQEFQKLSNAFYPYSAKYRHRKKYTRMYARGKKK